MKVRNTFVIFIVSGFWHGANWTFIVWGALNAIYFLPLLLTKNNRNNLEIVAKGKFFPSIKEFYFMLLTFGLTVFSWIFFRANNIGHAISYISEIFSSSLFTIPEVRPRNLILLIMVFVFIEWLGREGQYALSKLSSNVFIRWPLYFSIILIIYFYGNFSEEIEFIYFQF